MQAAAPFFSFLAVPTPYRYEQHIAVPQVLLLDREGEAEPEVKDWFERSLLTTTPYTFTSAGKRPSGIQ